MGPNLLTFLEISIKIFSISHGETFSILGKINKFKKVYLRKAFLDRLTVDILFLQVPTIFYVLARTDFEWMGQLACNSWSFMWTVSSSDSAESLASSLVAASNLHHFSQNAVLFLHSWCYVSFYLLRPFYLAKGEKGGQHSVLLFLVLFEIYRVAL